MYVSCSTIFSMEFVLFASVYVCICVSSMLCDDSPCQYALLWYLFCKGPWSFYLPLPFSDCFLKGIQNNDHRRNDIIRVHTLRDQWRNKYMHWSRANATVNSIWTVKYYSIYFFAFVESFAMVEICFVCSQSCGPSAGSLREVYLWSRNNFY